MRNRAVGTLAEDWRNLGELPHVSAEPRADFADASIATQEIEALMLTYNIHMAHPFEWKKGVRFYKRLKDKIAARSELQLAA